MTKLTLIIIVLHCMVVSASSQSNSAVTLSYQHLTPEGNHGIGAGFRTKIWNKAVLLMDASYFFRKYHGVFNDAYQEENYSRYAGINLNLGYPLSISEQFKLLPYAGIGLFYQNINGYMSSNGQNIPGGYPGLGAPFYAPLNDQVSAPVANIGVLLDFYLDEQFFLMAGAKSQIDVYDGTQSFFPYLSFGVGYSF